VIKKVKKKKKAEEKDLVKLKREIRSLKLEKATALDTGNKALLKKLRKRIKRLKRETRRVASAG
jgi:hypothetical protein